MNSTNTGSGRPTTTITSFGETDKVCPESVRKRLTAAIANWIVRDSRPLTVTEDTGFRNVLRVATGCGQYTPPCYATVRRSIQSQYDTEKAKVQSQLASADGVALTVDFWTSVQNVSYMGVTGHYVSKKWKLQRKVLDVVAITESHTAAVCGKAIADVAEEWKIREHIQAVVTDRGRNIVKGVEDHTPFVNVNCIAHIIQRAIASGLKASGYEPVLVKSRKIVSHFRHSPLQKAKLSNACLELNLKHVNLVQDVSTRWFSCLATAQVLLSQKDAVAQVLEQDKHFKIKLNESDFTRLRNLVDLLTPVKAISDFMGGDDYVTGSCTLHVRRCLENAMKPTDDDAGYVALFKRMFLQYMDRITYSDALLHSAAIDPRLKKLTGESDEKRDAVFQAIARKAVELHNSKIPKTDDEDSEYQSDEQMEMQQSGEDVDSDMGDSGAVQNPGEINEQECGASDSNIRYNHILEIDSESEEDNDEEDFTEQEVQAELTRYRSMKKSDINDDPLAWWAVHETRFMHLSRVARAQLCIPGSSVSCERLFSAAGCLVSKRRASLSADSVKTMLCLQSWLRSGDAIDN